MMITDMSQLEKELIALGHLAHSGDLATRQVKRLGELVIQFHNPRHSVTHPTQDGLVTKHGVLKTKRGV